MYNICTRMMGNLADAEDVLQEAFISAFNNLHQLKDYSTFGGWLKRIVINECLKQTKKTVVWSSFEDNNLDLIDEDDGNWESVSLQTIHTEIKNLPNGCRQIFTLYAIEDYSHKQIASALNISESTSKSQYHRAKTILKQKLSKKMHHYG